MLGLPYHSPSAGIPSPHMLSYIYIYTQYYIYIYLFNTVPCLDHDTYRRLWMVTGIKCCFCFKSTIWMLNLAFGATRFCPKHGGHLKFASRLLMMFRMVCQSDGVAPEHLQTIANNVGPQLGIAKLVALARLTVGFMVVLTKYLYCGVLNQHTFT